MGILHFFKGILSLIPMRIYAGDTFFLSEKWKRNVAINIALKEWHLCVLYNVKRGLSNASYVTFVCSRVRWRRLSGGG